MMMMFEPISAGPNLPKPKFLTRQFVQDCLIVRLGPPNSLPASPSRLATYRLPRSSAMLSCSIFLFYNEWFVTKHSRSSRSHTAGVRVSMSRHPQPLHHPTLSGCGSIGGPCPSRAALLYGTGECVAGPDPASRARAISNGRWNVI